MILDGNMNHNPSYYRGAGKSFETSKILYRYPPNMIGETGMSELKGTPIDPYSEVIEPQLLDSIRNIASKSNLSLREIIRQALDQYLSTIKFDSALPLSSNSVPTYRKTVTIIPAAKSLVGMLREKPEDLLKLTPDQFEDFVCERLESMGWEIQKSGSTFAKDGGIDIVARPSDSHNYPFLLGVQAKHHSSFRHKEGYESVQRLYARISGGVEFSAGMLVTSTFYTAEAVRWAQMWAKSIRLRDYDHVKDWVSEDFNSRRVMLELPNEIQLFNNKPLVLQWKEDRR